MNSTFKRIKYLKTVTISLLLILCIGCSISNGKLNGKLVKFERFADVDSLTFDSFYNGILEEPSEMLLYENYLIINDLNHANDEYISIFSLDSNRVIKTCMLKGNGPNEMRSCTIAILEDNIWLYDMGKFRIGNILVKELMNDSITPVQYDFQKYFYDISMLNDSIMVGTNDLSIDKKISFVNIKNGDVTYAGDYLQLNDNIPIAALIDAYNCYVNVNPKSRAISLAYRYTDVLEIYNSCGVLEYSIQGPEAFDIEFEFKGTRARKNVDTRKAFVNSYVTEDYIYLLYSGCTRKEKNWSYGTEIYVYSWEGKPVKKYVLNEPIYTFAVDEDNECIYSYSLQTSELTRATI